MAEAAKVKPSDEEKVKKRDEGQGGKAKNGDRKTKELAENTKEPKKDGKRPLQTPPSTSTTASSCGDGKRAKVDGAATTTDKRRNPGPTGSSPEKKKLRFGSDAEAILGAFGGDRTT